MCFRGRCTRITYAIIFVSCFCFSCAQEPSERPTTTPLKRSSAQTESEPIGWELLDNEIIDSHGMSFVMIPPGTFEMGSETGDDDEKPVHTVRITKPFYFGKYEVTQKQWRSIVGENPSTFKGDELPVESISWIEIQRFLRRINQFEGRLTYRLPTEAEWEYAARAGSATDGEISLDAVAWHEANSREETHPVGRKQPNAWGIYDVYGNVWEWCRDRHGAYPARTVADPTGAQTGVTRAIRGGSTRSGSRSGSQSSTALESRVFRGGSWMVPPNRIRSTDRGRGLEDYYAHNVGLRLVKIVR